MEGHGLHYILAVKISYRVPIKYYRLKGFREIHHVTKQYINRTNAHRSDHIRLFFKYDFEILGFRDLVF